MKIGGVQKSLCNLLWSILDQYDVTLFLFSPVGEYMDDIPKQVHTFLAVLCSVFWNKPKRMFT